MRIGLWSLGLIIFILFLIILNETQMSSEKIDTIIEGIDVNTMDKLDQNTTGDANLMKFAKYTAKGIVDELHGTYYLASWLNTFLPSWLIENLNLLLVLVVLSMIAPVIFYGTLTIIMLCMVVHEKWSEWRRK